MSDRGYGRPMLDRVLGHAELMHRMMERVGIDAAAVARLEKCVALYKARTRCIGCRERQCSDWLARFDGDAFGAPPEFCSDAEVFRRLRSKTP